MDWTLLVLSEAERQLVLTALEQLVCYRDEDYAAPRAHGLDVLISKVQAAPGSDEPALRVVAGQFGYALVKRE